MRLSIGLIKRAWRNPELLKRRVYALLHPVNASAYSRNWREIREARLKTGLPGKFIAELASVFQGVDGTTDRGSLYGHGALLTSHAELIYELVMAKRPGKVVETGV